MRERPILFSGPMVRAILDGQKTQTRRVLKQATGPSLSVSIEDEPGVAELSWLHGDGPGYEVHETIKRVSCPYGQLGDRLWVRESFRFAASLDVLSPNAVADKCLDAGYRTPWAPTQYEADGSRTGEWRGFDTPPVVTEPGRLRPSIHMPRWASRILLEITGVRVERLQEISEADARDEGITDGGCTNCGNPEPCGCECPSPSARDSFAYLWESINGADSWVVNPWVWAVEFRRITP